MKLLKFCLVALLLFSCAPEKPLKEGFYRINGTISGLDNGEIYLMNYPEPMDTVFVENGKFTFEKEIKASVGQLLLSKETDPRNMNDTSSTRLFIEPKILTLTIDYSDFSKAVLSGSITQDEGYVLNELTQVVTDKFQNEIDGLKATGKKYREAAESGASEEMLEKIKYEDNEWRIKLEPMYKERKEITLDFIKTNPTSYVSVRNMAFIVNELKYSEAKTILEKMNPEHLNTKMGENLLKSVDELKNGIPGVLAGDFNTTDINGTPIRLADFKGQYLLIDFWASWCVPCRKGNPHLIKLYEKYNSKGLEILGVSDDDREHDKWRKAVAKDKIGIWRHVLRGVKMKNGRPDFNDKSTDISDGYNISTLPTKILVGPDGVIVGRYGGGGGTDEDMDKDLAKIFE